MYRAFLFLLLAISFIQENESQQIQMQDEDAPLHLTGAIGPAEQLAELQRNVSSLWTYIYELRGAVTHHLNHLRQHQVEMENVIHRLEHHGDGHGDSHSASYTAGHSHSGEDHSHSSSQHSHSGEDHHHSGEHHSHGDDDHSHGSDDHSHGSDGHSHGSDDHSHGTDGHSHSGEHQSHGHYHDSHSHSHTDGDHAHGHEDAGHHHDHKDSHENADDLQQTAQVSEPLVEPVIVPSTRPSHNHHHHHHSHGGSHSHVSSSTPSSSAFQPLNVMGEDSHHHSHAHVISSRNRTRTVIMPKYSEYDLYELAVCNVQPNRAIPTEQQQNIVGQISLWQKKIGGSLNIHVRLSGFAMGDHHANHQQQQQQEEDSETPMVHKHGFHIHSSGDLSNGCQSTGPHFNPKNMNHGGPKALVRHVGDLGNIECDEHGVSNLVFSDEVASLKGPYSIVGKSMVIHAGQDDLGLGNNDESLKTGNAGVRIACCVIQKVDKLPIRSYRAVKTATQYQNW